jgi:hypothetical protein
MPSTKVRKDQSGEMFPDLYGAGGEPLGEPSAPPSSSRQRSGVSQAGVDDAVERVEVRDNGIGGADPSGHGLVGIADRVSAIGGQLVVERPESGGTLLAAELPVPAT